MTRDARIALGAALFAALLFAGCSGESRRHVAGVACLGPACSLSPISKTRERKAYARWRAVRNADAAERCPPATHASSPMGHLARRQFRWKRSSSREHIAHPPSAR
eukprot:366028-Chlamydomonas_euryale.AAC.33